MSLVELAREKAKESYPMKMIESGGVRYFTLEKMNELGLRHLFSSVDVNLKVGGRSEDPRLHKDWQAFIDLMPKDYTEYYFMYQKHTDLSLAVDEEGMGEKIGLGRRIMESDGLMTCRSDFMLSSSFADCAPLLFFDPKRRVQANVHSGWRGTLADIGGNTVDKLVKEYAVDPKDLYVAIGPHIGFEDFEVDEDVALLFSEKYPEVEGLVKRKGHTPEDLALNKYLVNLNYCILYNLLRKGIPGEQIISVNRSTVAHPEDFHSYRRDKEDFGLMMVLSRIYP